MDSNDELVDYLVERGLIESERVEREFRNVDRAVFVEYENRDLAYIDSALSIVENSTISAPHMVAINTELLEVEENDRVLEVGSGSGYQLAILSELARDVVGVEIIGELVENSRERLKERDNVEIVHGNGLNQVSGKFDRILYSCAIESFDEATEKLKESGIVVAPVLSDDSQILKKWKDGKVSRHARVSFVPRSDEIR